MLACNKTKVAGVDLNDFDLSVAPSEDFYEYATGGWQKNNPLRPEFSRYGSFDVLRENNEIRINGLFQDMTSTKAEKGSVEQKIADLYCMGMDSVRLNAEGARPIMDKLSKILALENREQVLATIIEMHSVGENPFFGTGVGPDFADSNMNVMHIGQGGLLLGNRDYYLDEANANIKDAYKNFLKTIFGLCSIEDSKAQKMVEGCLRVEDAMAMVFWTKVQNRDMVKRNNPMTYADFKKKYNIVDWDAYFTACGAGAFEKIIIGQPSALQGTMEVLSKADIEDLKCYLAAYLVNGACSSLSDDFQQASFELYGRVMSGKQEQRPRWKRAMAVPNSILSEAVGQVYVAKFFPEEQKQQVLDIVRNLQTALSEHIDKLDWMSDETKVKAQEKLASFTVKIGYPDKWKDYSTLDINPENSYYDNLCNAMRWYEVDEMSKVGTPVDKDEWGMSPQTVNAYYNPTSNEICFPAAILQPPFYNPEADDAVNYGAIGVVIGHEMTHGFDDQGRLFDKDGNMQNWWTEADSKAFQAKTAKLVEQFNEIEILPGLYADGALSLGENIADQGGLRVAFTAFKNHLAGVEPAPVDGFTAEQRFYLGYAKLWAQNITDEEKAHLTKQDVHSLGKNRVNATLRNIGTFFEAFSITDGAMYRAEEDRVIIW